MQKLWDSVRASRPGIFKRPRQPLIETLGTRTDAVGFSEFVAFFKKFVEISTPKHPLTPEELRRLLLVAGINTDPPIEYRREYGYPAQYAYFALLASCIVLRDLHISYCKNGEQATEFVARNAEALAKQDSLPFQALNPEKSAEVISDLLKQEKDVFYDCAPLATEIVNKIDQYYDFKLAEGIESTYAIPPSVLEKLVAGIRKMPCEVGIGYPYFYESRLFAILGDKPWNSYFVRRPDRFNASHGRFTIRPFSPPPQIEAPESASQSEKTIKLSYINARLSMTLASAWGRDYAPSQRKIQECGLLQAELTESNIALVAMYPWEADHLEKAKEMASRGVRVTAPLGRLIVDEKEFALFHWAIGKALVDSPDTLGWEAYGHFVKFCHENGIALEDVAGRNAMWDGNHITGIDFEHTWLTEEVRPLSDEERSPGLERIKRELEGNELLDIFMRAYHSKAA